MKHNKKKFIKFTFWLVLFMTLGFGVFNARAQEVTYLQGKEIVKEVQVDNLSKKIDEIKDEAVNGIMKCESAGHTEGDGIIIFDSNNKASIGQFQFQKATVIHYYKTLYNTDIDAKEAVLIALDTDRARKLTKDVIFKTDKGYTNWVTCSDKIGMKATLNVIHTLEK